MARVLRGCAAALVVVLLASSCASTRPSTSGGTRRPNIVFLLTDDLNVSEMAYMPNVARLLTAMGVSFTRYYVSVSLCCPSRTSLLRGQYAHNTGVESNGGSNGGFETAHRLGVEQSTVGTWLHDAGYRTAYIGKYLNAYPDTVAMTYVPPGWDEFDSAAAGDPYSEYRYTLNENGHLVSYGRSPSAYGTDVYVGKASNFIESAARDSRPFFVYLNVYAPHQPATPAPADRHRFATLRAPRGPTFNAAPEPTKPRWLRRLHAMRAPLISRVDGLFRQRIKSLQAVDRGVGKLVDTLQQTGQLANTYFVFSSDNGFHLGQFRMPSGKETAYETDIRVPLIVRGPGVPHGASVDALAGNIDIAPTFAALAGVNTPSFVDGRSLVRLLHDPQSSDDRRQSFLVEHWRETALRHTGPGPTEPRDADQTGPLRTVDIPGPPHHVDTIPEFHGVRTRQYLYVEYATGERELYATDTDPFEIHNLAGDAADANVVAQFHALVRGLESCRGSQCRKLEDAPAPPTSEVAARS